MKAKDVEMHLQREKFNNEKGAMSLGVDGDDIYIKCNPVGENGEILEDRDINTGSVIGTANSKPLNWDDMIKNPVFEIVLGVIVVSIVVLGFRAVMGRFKRSSPQNGGQGAPWK